MNLCEGPDNLSFRGPSNCFTALHRRSPHGSVRRGGVRNPSIEQHSSRPTTTEPATASIDACLTDVHVQSAGPFLMKNEEVVLYKTITLYRSQATARGFNRCPSTTKSTIGLMLHFYIYV